MNRQSAIDRDQMVVVVHRARRQRLLLAGAAAVALLIAGGAALLMSGGEDRTAVQAAGGEAPGGQLPTVTVIVPGRTEVARTVTASGSLAARRDQPVGIAGEGGLVTAVLVDAGSWVRQGQVLAIIERSVQAQQSAQLVAQIASARANAALAQSELDRARSLVSRGFVSKADLDRKRAARDAAAAQVRVAQAQLAENRARIGRLDIRAPSSGLILSRSVEVGQVVGPGAGGLFRLARGGEMEMRAAMSQQDLALMKVGLPATVTPLGSDRSFAGSIWQIAPVIDPRTRQGEVRIAIPYDPLIRPGGFAEARISAGASVAPLLPQSAVLSDNAGSFVYIVTSEGKVERRGITIGTVSDAGVTVAQGLDGGERVVLSAGPFLNPGQQVAARRQAAAQ